MKAALDTTIILGRGAVQDTYNLIAHGIEHLCEVLAATEGQKLTTWVSDRGLERYFASSIKSTADMDWADKAARDGFLSQIIEDGKRVLELAREVRSKLPEGGGEDEEIKQAAELLTQLLWQDVEPTKRGYGIKQGTARDRVPSVHDPDQRHGRKSHNRTFTGWKGGIAVDPETRLVTAVDVVPGNAPDGERAANLVEDSEANTGSEVEQVIGDTAYGSMDTREALDDREVIAPTVKPRSRGIAKDEFDIDVAGDGVRCPMGNETGHWTWVWVQAGRGKPQVRVKRFAFPTELCRGCPRHDECVTDKRRRGRSVALHPQEARLQHARALEGTEYFRQQYAQRVIVEHRFARLVQLGIRQGRYFGGKKTLFQLAMAAAVANLTLVANSVGSEALLCRLLSAWRLLEGPKGLLRGLELEFAPGPRQVLA